MKVGVLIKDDKNVTKTMEKIFLEKEISFTYLHDKVSYAEMENMDFAVSIGGDGTILALARIVGEMPILGINGGHLGFLADTSGYVDSVLKTIDNIKKGNYVIDKRMRLDACAVDETGDKLRSVSALNDIVIKGSIAKMCKLKTYVNDEFVAQFPADGIIVSTATGSTGYSLSAGGPIIPPDMPANVITPICPHMLNGRSIIVNSDHKIEIVVDSYHPDLLMSADGQVDFKIKSGDKIVITKSKMTTNFIRVQNESFYSILSYKLGWNMNR